MSIEQRIAGLEKSLKDNKEAVKFAEDLRKLVANPLFRKLIIEEFTIREAARYVQESGDPLCTAEQRADALALAQAGGHLKRWIEINLRMGDVAVSTIEALELELDDVRALPETDEE